ITMDSERCRQPDCPGLIEDGYCNVCGHAAAKPRPAVSQPSTASASTGATSPSQRSRGSRRISSSTRPTSPPVLAARLVAIPELPSTAPEEALMAEARVPENKRYCSRCDNPLRREQGFCGKCGQKYSFLPSVQPGELVADQYEVKGALAFGGLGWLYLGFDQVLSRYVVLKGLLNTEDEASAAVAVAERQFLAAVKHANIVGIYNFVRHGKEGFIVMEYVGGETLKHLRQERGLLPVTEAIAYIHRILGAFAYLHQMGFVYCDFKPDNVMLEGNDVKLIDLGGVRRLDDPAGDIYGTVGYSAPEVGEGPTVASDLFTIGRTLAVLVVHIQGFSTDHLSTLPTPQEEPLFAQHESLYRWLCKATHHDPDGRFQAADQMAEQLLGVLREIVALETNIPRPAPSMVFGDDPLVLTAPSPLQAARGAARARPLPPREATDRGLNVVVQASAVADAQARVASLQQAVQHIPASMEARLRLASSLIDTAAYDLAEHELAAVEAQ